MATRTPADVRKQIAAGDTDPIYLLQGEDDVEKSALASEFAELVDEGLRAFNVERIHAGEMTSGDKLADMILLFGQHCRKRCDRNLFDLAFVTDLINATQRGRHE